MPVSANSSAVEKVVLNLLAGPTRSNSIPQGGAITVALNCREEQAFLSFQDTGIGIAAKDLAADFRTVQAGGRVVHPQVSRHWDRPDSACPRACGGAWRKIDGGRVSKAKRCHVHWSNCQLQRNDGETVDVADSDDSDPVARLYHEADRLIVNPHSPPDRNELSEATGEGTRTVLVIEDEPDLRNFVVSLLSPLYRACGRRRDGKLAGLDTIKACHRPELVLVDLMLPEMDGLDVCREVKSDPDLRHIKVVLLTARTDEQSKLTGALGLGRGRFPCKNRSVRPN